MKRGRVWGCISKANAAIVTNSSSSSLSVRLLSALILPLEDGLRTTSTQNMQNDSSSSVVKVGVVHRDHGHAL